MDGSLPTIPLRIVEGIEYSQYFQRDEFAVEIVLNIEGEHPEMSLIHETGHFVDHQGFGHRTVIASVAEVGLLPLKNAINESEAVRHQRGLL